MILLKSIHINFHIDKKKILFKIVLFSLAYFLLCLFAALSSSADFAQLKALWRSDYVYSAATRQPVGKDDYYQFDAGINFALSSDANASLNADILMQSDNSEYTDVVYWNANKLKTFGVAISKGLAVANDLDTGDKLYSNHIVKGEMCEYFVEQILPEVSSARNMTQRNFSAGVIIMGYDSQYVDNISHAVIAYANDPVGELSTALENILYRNDEIAFVCAGLVPYVGIFALLSVLNTVLLVFFLSKDIEQNFRRLIALGFSDKELDKAYNSLICGLGCILILVAAVISATVLHSIGFLQISTTPLILMPTFEFAALLPASAFSKNKLWRK